MSPNASRLPIWVSVTNRCASFNIGQVHLDNDAEAHQDQQRHSHQDAQALCNRHRSVHLIQGAPGGMRWQQLCVDAVRPRDKQVTGGAEMLGGIEHQEAVRRQQRCNALQH